MNTLFKSFLMSTALGLAIAPAAQAQQNKAPADMKDNSYVTISGKVGEILDADEFNLSYSGGAIKVDTNDGWPNLFRTDAIEVLKPGDKITVTGLVDDNLFVKKEIDAISISHHGETYSRLYWHIPYDNAYYGYWPYYGWDDKMYDDKVSISGTVSKILSDTAFEMKYGAGSLKVTTDDLNVHDADRLRVGDRVMVYGEMDDNWFGKRELDADHLVRTNVYGPRG
jgi:uncharacterized protein YdeI (BOF family)